VAIHVVLLLLLLLLKTRTFFCFFFLYYYCCLKGVKEKVLADAPLAADHCDVPASQLKWQQ